MVKRVIPISLKILVVLLLVFTLFRSMASASNQDHTLWYDSSPVSYSDQYGTSTVGHFKIDGKDAFCIVHADGTPASNQHYDAYKAYSNTEMKRALYYGWAGPKNIFSNFNQGYVITSLVLSELNGYDGGGHTLSGYQKLYDIATTLSYRDGNGKLHHVDDVPESKYSFSSNNLTVNYGSITQGGKTVTEQYTETVTMTGDPQNTIYIPHPSGTHVWNVSEDKNTGYVSGGQRFYIYASAKSDAVVNPDYNNKSANYGKIMSSINSYQPYVMVFKGFDKDGKPYQPITYVPDHDPYDGDWIHADFTPRTVKVYAQYIDTYDNSVMWQDDDGTATIGGKYSISSSTHGFTGNGTRGANGCTYKETGASTVTGTTGNTDVYVKFYYDRYRNNQRIFQNKYKNDQIFYDHTDQIKVGDNYSFPIPHQINDSGDLYDLYQDGVLQTSDYHYTGTQPDTDISKTFYYILQRPVDVKYKDNRTGNEIGADKKYTLHQGDAWDEHPAGETENGYTARYVGREDNNYQVNVYDGVANGGLRGTINTNPLNIDYYYDIPLMKIGVKDLQIYTANQNQGLPVKVQLDKSYNYDTSIGDMGSKKINVSLYQGSTRIATNQYAARDVPSAISWTIPSSFLSHQSNGSDLPYTVGQGGMYFLF